MKGSLAYAKGSFILHVRESVDGFFIRILELYNDSFSTHLLTVLIIHVIVHVEQRKGIRVEDSERNQGTLILPMLGNMWVADFNEKHFGRDA